MPDGATPTYAVGVTSAGSEYGLIQNFSRKSIATKVEEADADGDTAFVKFIDKKEEASCEYVLDTTKTVPVTLIAGTNPPQNILLDSAFGTLTGESDEITIDGVKWYIDDAEKIEGNKACKRLKLSLSRYTANTLPAASA